MLNWFAGQRPSDFGDRDNDDGPETPAPVFAVRAFKQAIFGTPATNPTKQRRNSALDREATRKSSSRPIRPSMTRPKSANDAVALAEYASYPPSPTKGILLTPGTAGGRGKSVTFGDFRQATAPATDVKEDASRREQFGSTRRQRANSLEDQFFSMSSITEPKADRVQLRESSSSCVIVDPDQEPTCAAGQYWKREYDIYRENTSAEVRKLLTKQRAAKSFAREKDNQCSALSEELQNERLKLEKLDRTVADLRSQLEQMRLDLLAARQENQTPQDTMVSTLSRPTQQPASEYRTHKQSGVSNRQWQENPSLDRPMVAVASRKRHDMLPIHGSSIGLEPEQHDPSFVSRAIRQQKPEADSLTDASPVITITQSLAAAPDGSRCNLDPHPQDELKAVRRPLTTLSSTTQASAPVLPAREYLKATVESVLADEIEIKENILPIHKPTYHADPIPDTLAAKQILSRDGDVIPPDRVAAARARLAARRQLRAEA